MVYFRCTIDLDCLSYLNSLDTASNSALVAYVLVGLYYSITSQNQSYNYYLYHGWNITEIVQVVRYMVQVSETMDFGWL